MMTRRALPSQFLIFTLLCLCMLAAETTHGASSSGLSGHIILSTVGGSTPGAILTGETNSDNTGIAVSAAGDINHDGIADVLVGAYNAPNFERNGKTFLIDGRTAPNSPQGTIPLSSVGVSTLGTQFIGGRSGLASGVSTSAAGDFNGDGIDDLLIGTIDSESYVVYGQAGALPGSVSLDTVGNTRPGVTFKVTDSNFFSSHVVSGAGDVNHDGIDDILIGAGFTQRQGNDFVGRAYLIYGQSGASQLTGVVDLQNVGGSIPGAVFTGAQLGDEFGQSVSSAGDVNGDGAADLIIGAYQNFIITSKPGKAYLVYGKTGASALSGAINASQIGGGVEGAVLTGIHAGAALETRCPVVATSMGMASMT